MGDIVKRCTAMAMAVFSAVVQVCAASGPPSWWSGCAYDTNAAWFVGRGLAEIAPDIQKDKVRGKAWIEALADAARNVCCQVVAESASRSRETGEGSQAQLEQVFESRSQVKTLLRHAPNPRVLMEEARADRVYMLAGLARSNLVSAYRQDMSALETRIRETVEAAEEQAKVIPLEGAKGLGDALMLHNELDECRWMLVFLEGGTNTVSPSPTGRVARVSIEAELRRLSAGMAQLLQKALVADLAGAVSVGLTNAAVFYVYPITYRGTDIVGPFGDHLSELLSLEFGQRAGWVCQTTPAKATVWFCGRVAECGDGAQVVLQRMGPDGGIVSAAQRFLSRNVLANLDLGTIRPANIEQVETNALALRKGQKANSGLKVELQVKGAPADAPVVLREGATPTIAIRCNRDCRTRIIHIFADNTRTVIEDNFPIAAEDANKWVTIPVNIRITPPFGVEQVLVQAVADGDLPEIRTRTKLTGTGRVTIIDGDLGSELVRVRGSVNEAVLSEAVYTWSILPSPPQSAVAERMPIAGE